MRRQIQKGQVWITAQSGELAVIETFAIRPGNPVTFTRREFASDRLTKITLCEAFFRVIYRFVGTLGLLLLISGCATTQTLPQLQNQFVSEARERDVILHPEAVRLEFVPAIPGAAARCFYNQTPRLVQVSAEFWGNTFYSDDTRRQVVYHELGHCLLGIREHTQNLAVDVFGERPLSIMESAPIRADLYRAREAYWLDRLFYVDARGN